MPLAKSETDMAGVISVIQKYSDVENTTGSCDPSTGAGGGTRRRGAVRLGLLVGSSLATLALALGPVAAQTVPARSPSTFDAFGVPLTASQFDTPEYRADWGLAAINAATAYARGYTGLGVLVAVIDSGIDPTNPEFNLRISSQSRNFIQGLNPSLLYDTDIKYGHGTHVSGTIGAARDNTGMMGVAFDSNIISLFDLRNTIDAIETATQNNARVLNGSYGPVMSSPTVDRLPNPTYRKLERQEYGISDIYQAQALSEAAQHDVLMVFAAGNDRKTQPDVTQDPSGAAFYPFIKPENASSGIYQFYTRPGTDPNGKFSPDYAPTGPVDQSKLISRNLTASSFRWLPSIETGRSLASATGAALQRRGASQHQASTSSQPCRSDRATAASTSTAIRSTTVRTMDLYKAPRWPRRTWPGPPLFCVRRSRS
jgi:subtilase-type serine protease